MTRLFKRRRSALLLALLLALIPATLLAVDAANDSLRAWVLGSFQTSSGGGYSLTSLGATDAATAGGGGYSLTGRVGGLLPVVQGEAPEDESTIFLPLVTDP
jgi:hypothetical protein